MPRNPAPAPAASPAPNEVVVYRPDESIRLDVTTDGETVWLTQSQMAVLFGCTVRNIRLHLENIYASGELDQEPTRKDFFLVRKEGTRTVSRTVACYNLDAIISVGYRVNSIRGVRFRQWATCILREMLLNKLDEIKRIGSLERRMDAAEGDIKQVQAGVNYLVQQLSAPPPAPPQDRLRPGPTVIIFPHGLPRIPKPLTSMPAPRGRGERRRPTRRGHPASAAQLPLRPRSGH